jgi:hypothetical protein
MNPGGLAYNCSVSDGAFTDEYHGSSSSWANITKEKASKTSRFSKNLFFINYRFKEVG